MLWPGARSWRRGHDRPPKVERERSVNWQGDIPFLGWCFNSENQQLYNCTAEQIYKYKKSNSKIR